jgi:TolB protein
LAELTIRITQGVEAALPIGVLPLTWVGPGVPPAEDVAAVIRSDLARSGRFKPLTEWPEAPGTVSEVRYPVWRAAGIDSLVLGQVRAADAGRYEVDIQLLDVFQGTRLERFTNLVGPEELRDLGHYYSDLIYQRLTGDKGLFDSQIAYVTQRLEADGARYSLMVADSDGHRPKRALRSYAPIMSPAWSPDGSRLAYVTFEADRAEVYVQDLAGRREVVASHPGINGAPAWSPDGRRLALTLSRDGNPEIYVVELASRQLTRLTQNSAIDTEPAWLPDGSAIVFTSDRGGSPQLYQVPARGGPSERITFEGDYNADAAVSPDGSRIAMVHRVQGDYRIAVLDRKTKLMTILTRGRLDESPSFAPNGSLVLYAAKSGGADVLEAASVSGGFRQQLQLQEGQVREPSWSPLRIR